MNAEDHYRNAASHALAGFQLIEEGLKTYIGCYHETVRRFLPKDIAYRHERADIQDAALGKLVHVFSKVNTNDELISKLRKLVKVRDEIAHKAFLYLYGELPPATELESKASSFNEVAQHIGELLGNLSAESLKVVGACPIQGDGA